MEIDTTLAIIAIGATLDSCIGDPYWMPHPIRLFGNMIAAMERALNRGRHRIIRGGVTWLLLCGLVWLFFYAAELLLAQNVALSIAWGALFFFFGISNRCLIEEGLKVERILNSGDLEGARKQLSMIVGRETSQLDSHQIRSAVVETLSENLSDGVVAPLFYFAIGGVPLMMLYKMVNTLDSMVGYKSDRYLNFGRISAKMDDVANYIPARLTALLMVIAAMSMRALRHIHLYSGCHASPNSGYPESALSGVLDCQLGGPNYYFGRLVEKPYIGSNGRKLQHADVITTTLLNAKVALLCYMILSLIELLTPAAHTLLIQ